MTPSSVSNEYSLFEEQISIFKNAAASAGDVLRTMLSTMESGMVPSAEHVSTFQSMLHTLQGNYDSLYQTATGLLEDSALPNKGCSVDDLGRAVQDLRAQVLEKLREMERILSEFLAVEAKVASYMEALQDWRTKATELIGRMHEQQAHHEELDEAVRPYRLFLKAMDMEDSEEKETLFNEEIDKIFPAMVSRGLYSGKYYRSGDGKMASSTAAGTPEDGEAVQATGPDTRKQADVASVADNTETARQDIDPLNDTQEYGHSEEKTELDAAVHVADEPDMIQTKDAAGDDPSHASSCDEELELAPGKNISENLINTKSLCRPSDIKNFISNNIKNDAISLLDLLQTFRIITTEQILNFGKLFNKFTHIADGKIVSMLTLLAAKKILKKLTFSSTVWVMTSQNKINIDTVCNKSNISIPHIFSSDRSYPEKIAEKAIRDTVSQNERLLTYLYRIQESLSKHFSSIRDSIKLYSKSIKVSVAWNDSFSICSIDLPEEPLSQKRPYRLFVPTPEEGLPELKDLPAGVTCFAFYEGTLYRWEQGWQTDPANSHEAVPALSAEADGNGSQENPAKIETAASVADTMDDTPSAEDHETDAANSGEETAAAKIQSPDPQDRLEAEGESACRHDGDMKQEMPAPSDSPVQISGTCPPELHEAIQEEGNSLSEDMAEKASADYEEAREGQDAPVVSPTDAHCPIEETVEQMAARLAVRDKMPSGEEIMDIVTRLFRQHASTHDPDDISNVIAQVLMLLQAAALQGLPGCASLYEQFALATGTAQGSGNYAGYNLNEHFTPENHSQSLALAAYMYALFAPAEHDFTLQDQAKMYLQQYDTYFPAYPELKPLFAALCEIHNVEPRGFTSAVLAQLESEEEKAASMRGLQERAEKLMELPVVTVHLNGIPELLSSCFGHKSDYYACMEIIAQNKIQDKEIIEDILQETHELNSETYELNEKHLEDLIDSEWAAATKNLSTKKLTLKMVGRRQIRQAFLDRLELMKEWVESAAPLDSDRADKLRKLQHSILQILKSLPSCYTDGDGKAEYAGVVPYITGYLCSKLEQRPRKPLFSDALRTGFIELDDSFKPVIEKSMCDIPYYEPWRRVLKHISRPDMTLEKAEQAISADTSSPMFDNLHQLELLTRLRRGQVLRDGGTAEKAEKRAKDNTKEFQGNLELSYAAGRIMEQDKEDILQMLFYEEEFFSRRNFGCWTQFLDALQTYHDLKVASHKRELEKDIAQRKTPGTSSCVLDKAEQMLDEGKFAIAEEFVNVYDRNDSYQSEELEGIFDEDNRLEEFLQPENFDPLYDYSMNTLRGRSLQKVGPDYLKKHFPDGWTTTYKEESIKFVKSWPSAKTTTLPHDIQSLMESLGIVVSKVTALPHKKEDMFEVAIEPAPCDRPDYPHPIADFGTEMKSPLTVISLYGGKQAQDILDTVNQLSPSGHNIIVVLLDYALSRSVRSQLAELCHQSSGLARFIVIDRVLALYLALHPRSERMSILLSCALPYAFALQPFVRDGGPTSAEMFCGRTRELLAILDLNGAILVYGGRQLGKTALLQRAQSRFHSPANKNYAVFCSIKELSEEAELVDTLVEEVNRQTSLDLQPCTTMKTFCGQLDSLFHENKIQSMLLLLDEADNFLQSAGQQNYIPVQPLVDLRRTHRAFKFVFAGLNNVYRARNATMNNGLLGQIGHPLCIKPLSPADALRLILRPLRYLGFKPGKDAHLEAILSSTNYYPGILQFVGYKLAESLNNKNSRYYRSGSETPPVLLTSERLGSIMTKDDLNESIKEKFRLSLKMDERYFMLARCISMLYHFGEPMHDNYKGYIVTQIKELADEYKIHCLKGLTTDEYEALLDEMFEMGILHRSEDGVYRLRKRSFLDIIGPDIDRLENEIISENERSQN